MKNKDIEKNIKKTASPDKDKIWADIRSRIDTAPAVEAVAQTTAGTAAVKQNKKPAYIVLCFAMAIAVAMTFILPQFFIQRPSLDLSGALYVDINPSVQLTLDKEGKVSDVVPLNDDAALILSRSSKTDFTGNTPEEAAFKVWTLAYNAGYISPSATDNAVLITGAMNTDELSREYVSKIKSYLTESIKTKGVYCAVLTDSLSESAAAEENGYGISAAKYRLIQNAIKNGVTIAESEYATISVKEINSRIAAHGKRVNAAGGAGIKAKLDRVDDLLDDIEDEAERGSLSKEQLRALEAALDAADDALDALEDAAEENGDTRAALARLTAAVIALPELTDGIGTLKAYVSGEFASVADEIAAAKTELQSKYDECIQKAQDAINGYQKPDDFDFDRWLAENEEEFSRGWEQKKDEWQSNHRHDRDDYDDDDDDDRDHDDDDHDGH